MPVLVVYIYHVVPLMDYMKTAISNPLFAFIHGRAWFLLKFVYCWLESINLHNSHGFLLYRVSEEDSSFELFCDITKITTFSVNPGYKGLCLK